MHGGAAGEDPGGLGEMTEASKSEERSDVIGSAGGHLHLHAVAVPKAPHLAPSCPACLPPRACLLAPACLVLLAASTVCRYRAGAAARAQGVPAFSLALFTWR